MQRRELRKRIKKMGAKSRICFPSNGCLGCADNGSSRCEDCLGRPKDKKKISSKGVDDVAKSH